MKNRRLRLLFLILFLSLLAYGLGRLYFRVTDGFLESNIYEASSVGRVESAPPLELEEKVRLKNILAQPFYYLGKGCQSYVFASADGEYVIKFLKYQRFRSNGVLDYLHFLPYFENYRQGKIAKKNDKLTNVFNSWKLAYEELQNETGVVYVHLNKSGDIDEDLLVYDKVGFSHHLRLSELEFMVQKKAAMLCTVLIELQHAGDLEGAKAIIDKLLALLVDEYARGYADNDHALMQNTGVYHGQPVHIDVGQFVKNPIVTDIEVRNQEIFNKTWKFRIWLKANSPALAQYTDNQLAALIGESFSQMQPKLYTSDVGRIPNIRD